MQSAFVDIGLERDAFLYVSDFMELEDQDELDEVPTDRTSPAPEPRHQQQYQRDEAHLALPEGQAPASSQMESQPQEHREAGQQPSESGDTANSGNRERGGWRGRRRRRGRRGERMPESKFARPTGETQRESPPRTERPDRPESNDRPERHDRPERSERTDFGPPPGYQPMILPAKSSAGSRAAVRNRCARFVLDDRAVPAGHYFLGDLVVPSAAATRVAFPRLAGQTSTRACVRHAGRDGDAGRASHRVPYFPNLRWHHFPAAAAPPRPAAATLPRWKWNRELRALPGATRLGAAVAVVSAQQR